MWLKIDNFLIVEICTWRVLLVVCTDCYWTREVKFLKLPSHSHSHSPHSSLASLLAGYSCCPILQNDYLCLFRLHWDLQLVQSLLCPE